MVSFMEQAVPLYKIKSYDNFLYRVTKRLYTPGKSRKVKREQDFDDKPVGKFDSALSRAKNTVRELALCNKWDYFVTLTFDSRWDRYSLKSRVSELMQWIQNLNKKGYSIRYLLVPEFHEDGAVHFHGLFCGIDSAPKPDWWPRSVNLKDDGSFYDIWPEFSDRYGYSSVDKISDSVAVGFYVSKYITKSLADKADMVGVHTYYCSQGLNRALEVGSVYHEVLKLDSCCKFKNSFYKFGFCKFEDAGILVDFCEEVNDMFKNYIVTDPVSGELVGMFGGDDEDVYIQEMLSEFLDSGLRCSVYDYPDTEG